MSNNLVCSCGKPAQIACKCLSNLNFFCFAHLEQHMINDPDNHIPLSISHALMMQDPESRSRNIQLDKIEMSLLTYEKELQAHISSLSSVHNTLKESIDQIFQDYYTKYSKTLTDVKELRNKVEWYKARNSEEAKTMIEKYKSTKVRGILPGYHDIALINMVDIFTSLANKLGLEREAILKSGDRDAQEERPIESKEFRLKPFHDQASNPILSSDEHPTNDLSPLHSIELLEYPSSYHVTDLAYNPGQSYSYKSQSEAYDDQIYTKSAFNHTQLNNPKAQPFQGSDLSPFAIENYSASLDSSTKYKCGPYGTLYKYQEDKPVSAIPLGLNSYVQPVSSMQNQQALGLVPNNYGIQTFAIPLNKLPLRNLPDQIDKLVRPFPVNQAQLRDQLSKCDICNQSIKAGSIQLQNCGHKLHLECLVRTYELVNSSQCPVGNCDKYLNNSELSKLKSKAVQNQSKYPPLYQNPTQSQYPPQSQYLPQSFSRY